MASIGTALNRRSCVTASSCANFQKNIALIIGIFRQQLFLQFCFNYSQSFLTGLYFSFSKFTHFWISSHFTGGLQIPFDLLISMIQINYRYDLGMFARQFAEIIQVSGNCFVAE